MENNKLIAEFMEYELEGEVWVATMSKEDDTHLGRHLLFQTSWDWLMPVCQKIDQYLEDNIGEVGYFDDCLRSNDIDVRYQAVLEFINSKLVKILSVESNKLIAEFMQKGSEGFGLYDYNGCHYKVNELMFHTSWDWLMLVVEKIESTETENGYYDVRLHVNETKIVDDHFNYIIECHGGNRLENTYLAVVDFINQLTIKTDE